MRRVCEWLLAALLACPAAHAAAIDNEGYGYATGGVGSDEMQRLQSRPATDFPGPKATER